MCIFLNNLKLRQYTKNSEEIQKEIGNICRFLSTFDPQYLNNCYDNLHNYTQCLYGYLYLDPVKVFFEQN